MQTASTTFHSLAQGGIRPHKWNLLMSFTKQFNSSINYFTLDSSSLDGTDILKATDDNPLQYWDYYSYTSYRSRLQSMSWSSSLAFPHSVESSMADFTLNNYDNYFTPNTFSPIAPYILPGRPTKILAGYGNEQMVQQFVGVTQDKPTLNADTKSAVFHALGFMTEIFALRLSSAVALSNVRTDEALAAIFNQFGIASTAYSLDRGRNTIPFLFLEDSSTVGDALTKIMEAEGGRLFIDEQGVIQFIQRLNQPTGAVFTFNKTNVVAVKHSDETQVINRVVVKTNIRQLQDDQPIFFGSGTNGNATLTKYLKVPASSTAIYEVSLDNPLATYTIPTNGVSTTSSWFTAENISALAVTSNISVTSTSLTTEKLKLTFTNTNGFDVYIDALAVWAQPAKVIDNIVYNAFDQTSIDKYGEHTYETDNDLFGNVENCESFAYTILDAYAVPGTIIEMIVKGDYALQLADIVWLDLPDTAGSFQIIDLSTTVSGDGIEEKIKVKRYDPRHWFTLNTSSLDGSDILAP
jgi:hypothetical protein